MTIFGCDRLKCGSGPEWVTTGCRPPTLARTSEGGNSDPRRIAAWTVCLGSRPGVQVERASAGEVQDEPLRPCFGDRLSEGSPCGQIKSSLLRLALGKIGPR